MEAGVKVRVHWLGEGAPAVRVDVSVGPCVVEGHRSFLVVQEDANSVGGLLEVEGDGGGGAGVQSPSSAPADRPVAAVWTHRDGTLSVNGLSGHAQIPVCFTSNLKHNVENTDLN